MMADYKNKKHTELLNIINEVRESIKDSSVIQDMCKEHSVGVDYIDLVPMAFAELDVSARTDKGCIYFNFKLLDDGDFQKDDHYMVHELTHHFQQCHGDGPTMGSDEGDYLDNEYEQEGFQAQTEYLSETRGPEAADKYVNQVLDHHSVPEDEKEDRKDQLFQMSKLVDSLNKLSKNS